ncbi:glutamate racemase [bacterium]|nr:glutamate racemase [bacterium]
MGPVGVFDSGMGGLTVLRELQRRLPAEDLLYFGDTARVPYGTKGARTVREFARQDASFLVAHGAKLVVVACNTASAFAIDDLRATLPVPVLDVIAPGVTTALARTRGGRVGIIATRGTVESGRYQQQLAAQLGGDRVVARACPLFVPLAEEGLLDHAVTRQMAEEYLAPLREAGVDTLILGCTHYPLLKGVIGAVMGPDVALVDSAEALAVAAGEELTRRGLRRPDGADRPDGRLEFYLSDLPWKFREVGARFLGRPIDEVHTVNVNEAAWDGGLPGIPVRKETP